MVQVDSKATLDELLELCTVKLTVPGKAGWGTGFFVAPGKILTCAHVLKDAGGKPVKVTWQGQENFAEANVSGLFPDPVDLALLEFISPISNHPCVYLDTAVQSGDDLYTYGYPDDFAQGAPVTGQCEGLTGDIPPILKFKAGQVRPGLSGSPLLNRRTHKVCGIVKFTRDRSDDLGGGAITTATIWAKLGELKDLQTKFHKHNRCWVDLLPQIRSHPRVVVLTGVGIAAVVGIIRFLGVLQDAELKVYDHLMQTRFDTETQDERIQIVAVKTEDVAAQKARGEKMLGSLSNRSLSQLLTKLSSFEPRVIGLDIYREDKDFSEGDDSLQQRFQSQPNLIGVCKASDDERYEVSGIESPPGMSEERIGFSDFILDGDDVLRRQILAFQPPEGSPCPAQVSFALQVAGQYLAQDNFDYENPVNAEGACHNLVFYNEESSRKVTFQNLLNYTGGYQFQIDANYGCQVLLNYRGNQQQFSPEIFTLEEVLNGKVNPEKFRNKIVLIGVMHRDNLQDYWNTPFGILPEQEMPGVVVQAQMVSQIISVVKGEQSLIWVMPQWAEWLWILSWSVAGGFLGWSLREPRKLAIAIAIAAGVLYIICLGTFHMSGWLPLLPCLLSLGASSILVWWVNLQRNLGSSFNHSQSKLRSTSIQ